MLSRRTLDAVEPFVSPRAVAHELGARRLLGALGKMRGEHRSVPYTASDATKFLRWVATAGRGRGFTYWDPAALAGFRMTFPAHVRVVLRDGTVREAEHDVPRGGAGHEREGPLAIAAKKLRSLGPALWGEAGTERVAGAVAADDPALRALAGEASVRARAARADGEAS